MSQLEKNIFNGLVNDYISIPSNMSKKAWEALRGLADDRSIVKKEVGKGSCVVVWCRDDYIKEANKQLEDKTVYKDINFKEAILSDRICLIKAIEFLRVFTHVKLLRRKNSNIFPMISKKQLI